MASEKASFVWNDPFLLEEDERLIRDAAAAFAADKLAPRIADAYIEEKTDPAIFREMGEAGLLGITIPGRVWRAWRRLRHLSAGFGLTEPDVAQGRVT